jgi:predicted nucleotide-binding protein (sugar kinase/HSP70/actin superfamily)
MPIYIVPLESVEDIAEQRAEAAVNDIAQAVVDSGGEDIVPVVRDFMAAIIAQQILAAVGDIAKRSEAVHEH